MNSHDPLCPFIEDTDGIIYGWNECQCDLIAAVREDQNKVRPSGRLMYQSGYADGEAHGRENALYEMKKYIDYMICMPKSHSQPHTDVSSPTVE